MTAQDAASALGSAFAGLEAADAPPGAALYRGKVRDVLSRGGRAVLVASDRISAFDRVLSTVPWKGEILSRISSWWFRQTDDLVPNHLLPASATGGRDSTALTGRAVAALRCDMIPAEVVVRGYLTGSAWRDYRAGARIAGLSPSVKLPSGLRYCERFPAPLLTPSTKEAEGHDRPATGEELVASGHVDAELWREIERAALALFRRGQELAASRGLILVDTKYEFGIAGGRLVVADEIHTPDSSRYWYADGYDARLSAGEHQRELDKETFRRWLVDRGFSGDGEPPKIDDAVRVETALRYADTYRAILGEPFEPVFRDARAAGVAIASLAREVLGD